MIAESRLGTDLVDYWNHNSFHHRWLVSLAAQRLAPVSRSVVGIDPDPAAVRRVRARELLRPGGSAAEVLPGVLIRRAMYYRYLMHWQEPTR